MPLIVIALHPKDPAAAADFADYLDGLTIELFDRSFGNPAGTDAGHRLGSASYDPADPNATIVQLEEPLGPAMLPTAEAIAAIDIAGPLPFSEYGTPDLRLVVTRTPAGGPVQTIIVKDMPFNVAVDPGPLPAAPTPVAYAGLGPVAYYLPLPPGNAALLPGEAYLDIPTDGSALPYQAVLQAMQTVVAADPGGALNLTQLTPAQCQHIAREIVANPRLDPLPDPGRPLYELYRRPGADDAARRQFESDLLSFYATRATRADVLAKFVYGVSAALACQARSQQATQVGLTLPVFPGLDFPSGATPTVQVVVSQ